MEARAVSDRPARKKAPRPFSWGDRERMAKPSMNRREALKGLTIGASVGAVVAVIPADAARQEHETISREKGPDPGATYTPKFFSAHQYETLQALCQAVLPPDERSRRAIEAGAPGFIDLLTSENKEYQLALGGGMMWLDSLCQDRRLQGRW